MRPEDMLQGKNRPFNGEEFIESLRDGREVWLYGERVDDVTTHPAFANSARSLARLYDALHDDELKPVLTRETDTGSGGYTHRFFRAAQSGDDLMGQKQAIKKWAELSYGWMGRSPDYKASFLTTLGPNADFYGPWAENARSWYKWAQENVLFMNHAIVNPPIDRHKVADDVKDVYVTIDKEDDAGIYVSGAKVVATGSALTHYNFLGQNLSAEITDTDLATMFIAPMNSPGVKLICRPSYELSAKTMGTPFDYPLSSRFDENDAIIIFDNAFIPWENVLVHRDLDMLMKFYPMSGFFNGFTFQACIRMGVKLDFLTGLIWKALRCTGSSESAGAKVQMGEIVAYRNMMWGLAESMAASPQPWKNGHVLPNARSGAAYRVLSPEIYPKVLNIANKILASGLIYLPSSSKDFSHPEVDAYLKQYVRGSFGIEYKERIKTLKLLWDAVGTEFGGRHELYEINYAGNWEMVRSQTLTQSQNNGVMEECIALAEQCMSEYDEDGWLMDGFGAGGPNRREAAE